MLLAIHATAGADEDKPPAEGEPSAEPAKPAKLCMRNQKLEQLAGQLAELQHIPPSPELIRKAREAGVDANPLYAKFGVTGEFDSFKTWLENLDETADAPLICGRARYAERIVLVAAVRAGSLELVGKNGIHAAAFRSTGGNTERPCRSHSSGSDRSSSSWWRRGRAGRARLRSVGWARCQKAHRPGAGHSPRKPG
ncbi:MAG: hypothetical protein JRJ10_13540 [Deltaproteobacteria bacterium]|nr:hypothetical protein [Deltaproteobacteria bacterium]